ncbi:MAG: hypothetical protein AB1325_08790 [Nitrospirota bacterium]
MERIPYGEGYIKKSSSVLCKGVAARCAMIKILRLSYPNSDL